MTSKNGKICRICLLGTQDKYFSLFEPFKDHSPAYHINSITNIHLSEDDTLPETICTTCLLDLENAINFKIKCESSDAYLKKTLDDINDKTIVPKLELPDGNEVIVKREIDGPDCDGEYLEEDNYADQECNLNLFTDNIDDKKDQDTKVQIDVPTHSSVKCQDCEEVFKSKFKLKVHWNKVHKSKYFDCILCKARFCSEKALETHMQIRYEKCKILNKVTIVGFGKNRIFTCPTCKYSAKVDAHMLQHIITHTGEKKFKCSLCDKSFSQRSGLSGHLENIHKIIKKTLTCDICGLVIHSQSKFTKHMQIKHTSLQYECDLCNKILKSKTALINHIRSHEGLKNYSCEYCAKLFSTLSSVSSHKKVVHFNKNVKKTKNCPICPFKTKLKKSLDNHIEKHNSGDLPCEICGFFYPTELLLWVHKICHLSKDSIRRTCPFCGQMYERNGLMRHHMKYCHLKKKVQKYDIDEVIARIKKAWAADENQSNNRSKKRDISLLIDS